MKSSTQFSPIIRQAFHSVFIGVVCFGVSGLADSAVASPFVVSNVQEYFPDQVGNEWVYRGTMVESGLVQIAEEDAQFTNVSKVVGTETIDGLEVVVFHDTNPGNQGPSDSYYRRDAAGIRYYGSKPGTTLERQLVPYQIMRFPLEVPSSFEQFNRKGLQLGIDIDRDGQTEQVDIVAVSSVQGQEAITVPFGTFEKAIRLEAKMTMQVHLSESGTVIEGTDTMTVWFARGVGLLKYIERQTIPSMRSQQERMVEVTEVLEKVTLANQVALLHGRKSPSKCIFGRDFFHHKLFQVSMASCLSADSRELMPTKGLSSHQ